MFERVKDLLKAMEAGNYDAPPSTLVQGAATQFEDLSTTMKNTTFQQKHVILQKMLKVVPCKSMLPQFNRQLSYGNFGGSAVPEGKIGQDETSDYARVTVPMAFYAHSRKVTVQANMVAQFDGTKAEDRAASDAAMKILADVEFDSFRGFEDFSNAGVFDGNPLALPLQGMYNMHGLGLQIRQSDSQRNARDLMFAEFGSDDTVVISGGGPLTQDIIEDASVRSALNFGEAEKFVTDPRVASSYNKISIGKERIVLSGSPQESTGSQLRKQFTSSGTVTVEMSRFLSGKVKPAAPRNNGPVAPTSISPASTTDANAVTNFKVGEVYIYSATTGNEVGESIKTATQSVTIAAAGDKVVVTINHPGSGIARFFNLYRTVNGGAAGTEKFIGRVAIGSGSSTTFTDLNNRKPGFVTGFLIQDDTMELKEMAPYSRMKLAVSELAQPEAHFRFVTLAVTEPRKNVLVDNLQ